MGDRIPRSRKCRIREWGFVLVFGLLALAMTSIPYIIGAAMATDERVFGGFVYGVEDGYSYLAKMRQGAEGAWLFHIAYTPEPHPGALFFAFHLLLGKLAALLPGSDLTWRMVWVYHAARCVFGLGLLLTVYRFLAELTKQLVVRRLAWLMITFGGGLGWLLVALGRPNWLGSTPLDFILPEGFTFLVLYAFPHIAAARTLLLWGILALLTAWEIAPTTSEQGAPGARPRGSRSTSARWALLAGLLWLAMGLIVPFYVAVAWAITSAACFALALRERQLPWARASTAGVAALVSAPILFYSAWRFASHPVYRTWAAQNRILSPHPFHYLAAYGLPLALATFSVRGVWRTRGPAWAALAWVGVVPLLVYLPFNLQRRLVEGVQVPLSLLAAMGTARIVDLQPRNLSLRSRLTAGVLLIGLLPTNAMLVAGNAAALQGLPSPVFQDAEQIAALTWLDHQVRPDDVVLSSYETGNYLPVRARARAFVGHGPETTNADHKKALVARFFNAASDDRWRQGLLREYGVDYVFWGPAERRLGAFDPSTASYLQQTFSAQEYAVFGVEP